jgi:protoporphyrinogen/coproporphyrinogen III oxidase
MNSAGPLGRVAIVGAGVAGLAAAYFLRDSGVDVVVLEAAGRIGGKLIVSDIAGVPVDVGAEALLARRPEGVELIKAVGLGSDLVSPGTTTASIWTRGQFRPLPRRHFMGVPADFADLERSAILSSAGLERARQDALLPPAARNGDVAVAEFVGGRFGSEVVDRIVDPLLGGVYAGRSDQLSFDATIPALSMASRAHRSLAEAALSLMAGPGPARQGAAHPSGPPAQPAPPAPVFTTLASGLGTLPDALARTSGADVRTRAMVRELNRSPAGWRLTIGPAVAPERIDAGAVILALPARPASRLISHLAGAREAAAALGEIEYASMAIVTLAYPATAFPEPLTGSGYLVPAADGHPVKAVTYSTVKWPHLGGGMHVVRCSIGRIGEEAILQRDDADLAALAAGDLAAAVGVTGTPVASRVTRWGGGLPQYTVGHLDRVDRIRAAVAAQPGLAVCGAAYDGIGIPACIASARLAADQVAAHMTRKVPAPRP